MNDSDHGSTAPSRAACLAITIATILVVLVSLVTRLPAPWKLQLINDEQHHLKSWRNRYGTDDIYPLFLERLHATHQIQGKKLQMIERIYHSGPLAQRALICLVDPQPPLFPVLAETIEFLSNSSLIAIRIPSMLASLGSIYLMYLIGRMILTRDRKGEAPAEPDCSQDTRLGGSLALPLWLAGFSAIAFLPQTMAGFGRPYALTQCSLLATIYFFLKGFRATDRSPTRVLLLALITQSLQWMTWSIVGPLVLVSLFNRYRSGTPLKKLILRSSWYFVLSALLLCEMFIQLRNPTISQQGGVHAFRQIWNDFCIASPFANLAGIWPGGLNIGGVMFAGLAVAGVVSFLSLWERVRVRGRRSTEMSGQATNPHPTPLPEGEGVRHPLASTARLAILLTLACSLFAAVFIGTRPPFWMTYGVPATIVAAIGADWLFGRGVASSWALVVVLLAFGTLSLVRPADPYVYTYDSDTPYQPVAQMLREHLQAGDTWTALPYNLGNNLYMYGPLPEPTFPQTQDQFVQMLETRSTEHPLYVLTWNYKIDEIPELRAAQTVGSFRNHITLLRMPPRVER